MGLALLPRIALEAEAIKVIPAGYSREAEAVPGYSRERLVDIILTARTGMRPRPWRHLL